MLLDRDTELGVDAQDFGIDLVQTAELGLGLGLGVIIGVLVIDLGNVELGPVDLFHVEPGAIRLQPPVEHPLRLVLLARNEPHGVFVQTLGREILFDVARPAMFVIGDPVGGSMRFLVAEFGRVVGHAGAPVVT